MGHISKVCQLLLTSGPGRMPSYVGGQRVVLVLSAGLYFKVSSKIAYVIGPGGSDK